MNQSMFYFPLVLVVVFLQYLTLRFFCVMNYALLTFLYW